MSSFVRECPVKMLKNGELKQFVQVCPILSGYRLYAHNLKVVGSNPTPATTLSRYLNRLWDF